MSAYYKPQEYGLETVATFNAFEPDYDFNMLVVWRETATGKLWAASCASDSGCSCPTPFEDHTWPTDFTEVRSWQDAKELLDTAFPPDGSRRRYDHSDLRRTVQRALAEAEVPGRSAPMNSPNDTFICLSYLTVGALSRIGKSLMSDPEDRQPGWYIRAYSNEGYTDIRKYTRVTPDHALAIAKAVDAPLPSPSYVANAVDAQNVQHFRDRNRRRKEAEEAIARAQETLAALDAEEGE